MESAQVELRPGMTLLRRTFEQFEALRGPAFDVSSLQLRGRGRAAAN